jgi:formylglycine-generating enzyme required for sulfatase activity
MDYLQTLEFQIASLQRKIRLMQDLRFFIETSSPEELLSFGDELRAVQTSSGASVGSTLSALLGGAAGLAPAGLAPQGSPLQVPVAAGPAALPNAPNAPARAAAAAAAAYPAAARSGEAVQPAPAPEVSVGVQGSAVAGSAVAGSAVAGSATEALALIEPSMKPIPAGSFVMGGETNDGEKPPHKVTLGAYRLSDHLVTNKEYALFVAANPQWSKDRADSELRDEEYLSDWSDSGYAEGKDDNPVSFVSFYAAQAFAAWLGKRLPTEAEWECAARGGLVGKKYPGGDLMNDKLANLAKQYKGTTPVRKFEPNGFGLYDMAGNLFEWTSDWYGPYAGGEARDPAGPPSGDYKVVRGGSWMSGAGALRVSARVDMEPQSCGQVGIRLAD